MRYVLSFMISTLWLFRRVDKLTLNILRWAGRIQLTGVSCGLRCRSKKRWLCPILLMEMSPIWSRDTRLLPFWPRFRRRRIGLRKPSRKRNSSCSIPSQLIWIPVLLVVDCFTGSFFIVLLKIISMLLVDVSVMPRKFRPSRRKLALTTHHFLNIRVIIHHYKNDATLVQDTGRVQFDTQN